MSKLVSWEETTEMERSICKSVLDKPFAHCLNHLRAIRIGGHKQVGNFEPDTFFFQRFQGVEYRLQPSTGQLTINRIIKTFQVDIGCIQIRTKIEQRLFVYVTIRDKDCLHSFFMSYFRRIINVFVENGWFGVCKSDAVRIVTQS